VEQNLVHLKFLLEDAQSQSDGDLRQEVSQLSKIKNLLDLARPLARDRTILNG
jgi:hypothetical protein